MGGGGEAAHVGADLGDDDGGPERADPGDRLSRRGRVAEGLERSPTSASISATAASMASAWPRWIRKQQALMVGHQ